MATRKDKRSKISNDYNDWFEGKVKREKKDEEAEEYCWRKKSAIMIIQNRPAMYNGGPISCLGNLADGSEAYTARHPALGAILTEEEEEDEKIRKI